MKQLRITLDQLKILCISRLLFLISCILLLVIGYFSAGSMKHEAGSNQIYILLDISQSMLVQDAPDQSSRLDFAKKSIQSVVLNTPGSSWGATAFAGDSHIMSPLTNDPQTFLTLIQGVDYKNSSKQGSDILGALMTSINRFGTGILFGQHKTLLLLSDGSDDHIELPPSLIDDYKNLGIQVIIGGIGTTKGGPIILEKDVFGQQQYKIYEGKPVIVGLNENSLQVMANQLGGDYIYLNNTEQLKKYLGTGGNSQNLWWFLTFLSFLFYLFSEYLIRWRKK